MSIEKTDLATVFRNEKLSFDDFFSDFSKKYINFKNENIILDFSMTKGVDIENILLCNLVRFYSYRNMVLFYSFYLYFII